MAQSLSPTISPPTWRRIDARRVIQITAAEGAILYRRRYSNRRGEAPSGEHRAEATLPCFGGRRR